MAICRHSVTEPHRRPIVLLMYLARPKQQGKKKKKTVFRGFPQYSCRFIYVSASFFPISQIHVVNFYNNSMRNLQWVDPQAFGWWENKVDSLTPSGAHLPPTFQGPRYRHPSSLTVKFNLDFG